MDDGVVSPQEVEPGACEEITAKAQRTVADEIQSLAALAEKADVSQLLAERVAHHVQLYLIEMNK